MLSNRGKERYCHGVPIKKPDPRREKRLREVCDRIGYQFKDIRLLNLALSHSSLGNEGLPNYERLEFLGDAVLGVLVAEGLYRQQPEIAVGELTSRRSLMVSRSPLASIADDLKLGHYIQVGRGLNEGALQSPRIMADLVEAVLGAIYIDGGVEEARKFVEQFVLERFEGIQTCSKTLTDPKTRLNQWAQSHGLSKPLYEIIESYGPDHDPTFKVSVTISDIVCKSDAVKNKQTGEQAAASRAFLQVSRLARDTQAEKADKAGDEDIPIVWEE